MLATSSPVTSIATGDNMQPHWYASYTCSRREKQVARRFSDRGVECFLPLYHKVHRWSHDTRTLQLPLFPGYVFVRIPPIERFRVIDIPGVVRLVSFNGQPAAVPDRDIEILRRAINLGGVAEPHPFIKPGKQVEVLRGPFRGLKGTVRKSKTKHLGLIVSVDLLMRSIILRIDAADLTAC